MAMFSDFVKDGVNNAAAGDGIISDTSLALVGCIGKRNKSTSVSISEWGWKVPGRRCGR
jgi:hypothetical protein